MRAIQCGIFGCRRAVFGSFEPTRGVFIVSLNSKPDSGHGSRVPSLTGGSASGGMDMEAAVNVGRA